MTSHSEGKRKNQFCSERAEGKCSCAAANSFRAPCEQEVAAWSGNWRYRKVVKGEDQEWGIQAHHTLCIASVTKEITTNLKIDTIVREGNWCVNDKDNMIALPVWPMTINWYFEFAEATNFDGVAKDLVKPPPFAGRAQHDYDHPDYNDDVDKRCKKIADAVKADAKNHEVEAAQLATSLNAARNEFKPKLQNRETHTAWLDAKDGKAEDSWWHAFSMVGDRGEERAFPGPKDPDFANKFRRLKEAYKAFAGS